MLLDIKIKLSKTVLSDIRRALGNFFPIFINVTITTKPNIQESFLIPS